MNTDDDKISSLYHEADAPGPSMSLDESILAASRDAVEKPITTRGPFSANWPALASIAAIIVITIIIVPVLKHEESLQEIEQPPAEISRSRELADEEKYNLYSTAKTKKKAMDTPSPASSPVLLMESDLLSADQTLPAQDSTSSRAVSAPPSSEISSYTEKTEDLTGEILDSERSEVQAADSAPFAIYTPEMWEVKIARLLVEGNIVDARTEIIKLKEQFPDHKINPALLEKLDAYDE